MPETVTVRIEKALGYSGNRSGKSYIARIVGTDKQYIFSREFVDTEPTDKAEMFTARRKRKGAWTEAAALEPGLYEISRYGERTYIIVWLKDGVTQKFSTDVERATRLALAMDDGASFEEARIATKPPKQSTPSVQS